MGWAARFELAGAVLGVVARLARPLDFLLRWRGTRSQPTQNLKIRHSSPAEMIA
jgi:hypothetical protein